MQYQAHDYQKRATQLVIDIPRIGLFLDMGLGKTVITMTAIRELRFANTEACGRRHLDQGARKVGPPQRPEDLEGFGK